MPAQALAGLSFSWQGEARFAEHYSKADIQQNSGNESKSRSPSNFAPSAPPTSCLPSTRRLGRV